MAEKRSTKGCEWVAEERKRGAEFERCGRGGSGDGGAADSGTVPCERGESTRLKILRNGLRKLLESTEYKSFPTAVIRFLRIFGPLLASSPLVPSLRRMRRSYGVASGPPACPRDSEKIPRKSPRPVSARSSARMSRAARQSARNNYDPRANWLDRNEAGVNNGARARPLFRPGNNRCRRQRSRKLYDDRAAATKHALPHAQIRIR